MHEGWCARLQVKLSSQVKMNTCAHPLPMCTNTCMQRQARRGWAEDQDENREHANTLLSTNAAVQFPGRVCRGVKQACGWEGGRMCVCAPV